VCGIVGLYLKNDESADRIGEMFAPMLACMADRGPDSAGFAIYGDLAPEGWIKATLRSPRQGYEWTPLTRALGEVFGGEPSLRVIANHGVFKIAADESRLRSCLSEHWPELRVMSVGRSIEILKDVGRPQEIVARFEVKGLKGTHVIGHTRMATESAVTTDGSHPFSTGKELCLVHNGSLSNHNRLRERLIRYGIDFYTENDSEVAAGYLTWRLREGDTLQQALEAALEDLDGFYTFAVGTIDGFAVLRDPIACKPAVMAETDDYVAIGSEYRSLAELPGIDDARLWEPEPAVVYTWGRN
jgi:glutamate synthase domain-containing protein 1